MRLTSPIYFLVLASLSRAEAPLGKPAEWKTPEEWATPQKRQATVGLSPIAEPPDVLLRDPEGPGGLTHSMPFLTLPAAVAFIQGQRGLGGAGLPATFRAPTTTVFHDSLQQLVVTEGVGLYDASLAVLTLIEAGRLMDARNLLDYFVEGRYSESTPSPMELRALPTRANNSAFGPFNEDAYYFFDFTNLHGDWLRWGDQWKFWATHTGPNAWLMNALLRFAMAQERVGATTQEMTPYVALAEKIGRAMIRLQDKDTGGAIRYGPHDDWHDPEASAPFLELNTENNVSAYAALRLLARQTGNKTYADSADKILHWLKTSGVYDPHEGVFRMGMEFKNKRWVVQPVIATDSGGTWSISALGAETIDRHWGEGAAYRMWKAVQIRMGRTVNFQASGTTRMLAGLDFSDQFPIEESLISPEWTAGGLYALKELERYYGSGAGAGILSAGEFAGLQRNRKTMSEFLHRNPNAYAIGPGHRGNRKGATGFRWFSPGPEVQAMASLYFSLYAAGAPDPLGTY